MTNKRYKETVVAAGLTMPEEGLAVGTWGKNISRPPAQPWDSERW